MTVTLVILSYLLGCATIVSAFWLVFVAILRAFSR